MHRMLGERRLLECGNGRNLTRSQEEIPVTELIVLYRMPNDPERFDKYYREVHAPMTSKLPGLEGYKYGRVCALDGGAGKFFWCWSDTFDSRQAAIILAPF